MMGIDYFEDDSFVLDEKDFVVLTEEYIEFQKPYYNDNYLNGAKVGDWVYDDGEVLCSINCVYHWYSITKDEQKEKYRKIYEHLEKLNEK